MNEISLNIIYHMVFHSSFLLLLFIYLSVHYKQLMYRDLLVT